MDRVSAPRHVLCHFITRHHLNNRQRFKRIRSNDTCRRVQIRLVIRIRSRRNLALRIVNYLIFRQSASQHTYEGGAFIRSHCRTKDVIGDVVCVLNWCHSTDHCFR